MADKKFNLDFYAKVQTDVSEVKEVVKNLKAQLENLKLPAGATKNFEKSFERLEGQIRDFESSASNGINSLADTRKVQAAWDKITKSFSSLNFSLKELDTISDQIFPKEVSENIKKANEALKNYQNKLAEIKETEKYKAKKTQISEAEKEVTRTRTNYSNEQKKLANKRDEVTGLEKAWALRAEGYEKQAEKVRKLNEEYQNLSNTLDKMRTDKAALESIGAIDSSGKVSSKYKNLLSEKEGELADLEDEDKLREKNQKKQLEFEERISRAQEKLRKAEQNEKKSRNEEKKARWIKEQAEAQAELNAAQNDSDNFAASIEARKEALREEINLMKEHIALAEQVTQTQINEQAKKASEKKAELDKEKDDETFKEDKKLKKSLDTASAQLRTLESTSQSAKDALDTAEKAVEDLNNELNNIETEDAKKEWQEIVNTLKQFADVNLDETKGDIEAVKKILEDYTADEIKKTPEILEKLRQAASGAENPIRDVGKAADDTAEEFREMDRAARDMENLKDQILDFFSISNTIQIFKDAIRDAFDTVKELDAAMTETAVVTDFSVGDMWDKLPQYSEEATKLGASIKSLYEATTLYYQQGLNSEQAMSVGIETMKMARIANMDAAQATEAMTAALRGFNMEINETSATRVNDVYSELAAITAADTSQIATAMSKTASIAKSANMEFETTAALLAQIIETTQEAPETAGTAMKTIIARFTEVKQLFSEGMLTGEDSEGEEININKIDTALKTVGISLKDFLNGSKGIDDIFLELASKWDTLDLATQRYIATTAAGSRQQSRFLAMMSNYERTMELVSAATKSAGASQKQFDKTLDSLDAKLQRLKNAWNTFTMGLANNDLIKFGVDLLTKLLETINNLTDDLGGVVGGFAKLAITIGGLKIGKNIFNAFFDIRSAENAAIKINGLVDIIGKKFNQVGGGAQNVSKQIDAAASKTKTLTAGFAALGIGCGVLAQYFRSLGLEELATGLEMVGAGIIVVSNAISMLNSVAIAARGNIVALFGKIKVAITTAISSAWAAISPFIPVIAAVAAIIASVSAIAIGIYKASPEGKLKAAEKAAEKAGKAAQEATDAFGNLNSTLSDLDNKHASLENMTKGTQEWRDAVVALNDEMLKLIELYPELSGFIVNEGGVLKLDYNKQLKNSEGESYTVQDVLKTYSNRVAEAQQISYKKQIEEKKAEIEVEFSNKNFILEQDYDKLMEYQEKGIYVDTNEEYRKTIDELAIEIAKGNISNEEEDINKFFDKTLFNVSDYEHFDYYAFQEYGNYLLSQQTAIEGLTDASIAAQMAMMDFSDASSETQSTMNNLDDNFLRGVYENAQVKGQTFESLITEEDRKNYAKSQGYKIDKGLFGQTIYRDKDNRKVRIDDSDVVDYISNKNTNEIFGDTLKKLTSYLDSPERTSEQLQLFSQFMSKEGSGITAKTYNELIKKASAQESQGELNGDWIAQEMGFGNIGEMAETLGLTINQVGEILSNNLNAAKNRITEERKATVSAMKKYGKTTESYDKHAQDLARMEEKFGPEFNQYLNSLFDSISLAGDDSLTSAAFEQYMNIAKTGNYNDLIEANKVISSIDWSNPIQAVSSLQDQLKSGTSAAREMAKTLLQSGNQAFGSGKQLQYFVQSTAFEELKEDIEEVVDIQGELSAENILEMAESCSVLKTMMEQTGVSVGGLAKALTKIQKGEWTVNQLTDAVMAAIGSFDSLDSLIAQTLKTLSDFDPGTNENEVADFISSQYDILNNNLEKGAIGNTQNFNILDFMFGEDWESGLADDDLVKRMQQLNEVLKENSENMRASWLDLAQGKDVYGNDINKSALGSLEITDLGKGEIGLTGFEGMTTEEMVGRLQEAYRVSKEYAQMMLTDFKNYSIDLREELNTNDFEAGFEKAWGKLQTIKRINYTNDSLTVENIRTQKVIDKSEIEAIADAYELEYETVADRFEEKGALITNFYDEDGFLLQSEAMLTELERVFTTEKGAETGEKWYAGFTSISPDGKTIIDYKGMMAALGQLNIPDSAKAAISSDITQSIREGSAESGPVYLDYTFSDGSTDVIEVPANIDAQTAIANAERDLQNAKLGEAIAKAFGDMEINMAVDETSLSQITISVETAIQDANTNIDIKVTDSSLAEAANDITTLATNTTPVVNIEANLEPAQEAIDAYNPPPKTMLVYEEIVEDTHAKGIKNSPDTHTALIGEAGAEIHQTKDGAYLADGPQLATIHKGDTVYTAQETRQILKKTADKFPRYATGYGYASGKSGGASGGGDKEAWENPFDKLYNLVRKIDEELRQRERIERRYEKLLESINTSANKIISVSREELAQLERERMLQEQLIEGRKYQIDKYQQENADLMKYANVTQNERGEDVLRINWDLIDQVIDTEEGERIEEYVSQLEEWFGGLEEAEDALWEIEDAVAEIKERGKEEYFELEDTIKEALTQSYQEEIDKLSQINESINDTNSSLIEAIQKSIDKQRQDRDNQRTEEDIAEKQRRLAYLQQDTSGANDLEILRLQEEISQEQEDYTDTLIDQKISELQQQNDEAAKQREQQITLAQAQLDHFIESGEIWNEVYSLMAEGLDKDSGLIRGSRLEELLQSTEGFQGMSEIAKMEWLNETNNLIAQALAYLEVGRQLEDIGVEAGTEIEFINKDGQKLTGIVDEKGNVKASDGRTYNNVFQGADGRYYSEEDIPEVEEPEVEEPEETPEPEKPEEEKPSSGGGGGNDTTNKGPWTGSAPSKKWTGTINGPIESGTITVSESSTVSQADANSKAVKEAARLGLESYKAAEAYSKKLQEEAEKKKNAGSGSGSRGGGGSGVPKHQVSLHYKTGGLADFTGPAWLDGTKARPELVLNARDTANFIQLKDILSSIMTRNFLGTSTATENNGDINYDIDINVETIGSDYDVEQVANKVKSMISENGRYRNNNAISLKR